MRGLIGLRGQSMDGVRWSTTILLKQVMTSVTGSLTTTEDCLADIFAFGAGGSGASVTGFNPGGGGGGAAGYSRMILPARSTVAWTADVGGYSVGNPGNDVPGVAGADTTVTVNGMLLGTAQGGRGGVITGARAARSVATGFQVGRYGGGADEAGEFGGPAGGANGAGGGPGGFADLFGEGASPGVGGAAVVLPGGVPPVAPAGGGGRAGYNQSYSGYGGYGLVVINLYRIN